MTRRPYRSRRPEPLAYLAARLGAAAAVCRHSASFPHHRNLYPLGIHGKHFHDAAKAHAASHVAMHLGHVGTQARAIVGSSWCRAGVQCGLVCHRTYATLLPAVRLGVVIHPVMLVRLTVPLSHHEHWPSATQ